MTRARGKGAATAHSPPRGARKLISLREERQPEARVVALSHEAVECGAGDWWQRRDERVVLHILDGALAFERNLHAWIENSVRIEGVLHITEERQRFGRPHALEQRRPQAAVAMLPGEGSAESRRQRRDLVEYGL